MPKAEPPRLRPQRKTAAEPPGKRKSANVFGRFWEKNLPLYRKADWRRCGGRPLDFCKKLPRGGIAYSPAVCKCYVCGKGGTKKRPLQGEGKTEKDWSGFRPNLLCGRCAAAKMEKEKKEMSKKNNRINVPEAREAMDKFKMEAASEVGVNLKEGYNGDISAREAGSVGGQMVKKMIESYEKSL